MKWFPGKIIESHGNVMFTVELEDGRKVMKHTDQLISRQVYSDPCEEQYEEDDNPLIRADETVVTPSLPFLADTQPESTQPEDIDPNDNIATNSCTHRNRLTRLNQTVRLI